MRLWTDGYDQGLAEPAVADVREMVSTAISGLASAWLGQISKTTAKTVVKLLLGLLGPADVPSIQRKLVEPDRVHLIVVTEYARAFNQGRMDYFHQIGVLNITWHTTSASPCQRCLDNEAAGPVRLGTPFPSGALCPPDHPNCGCYIERA